MTTSTRRGRPQHTWLSPAAIANLPAGTALAIQTHGRHDARTVARLRAAIPDALQLTTRTGEVTMATSSIRRARVVPALYEPGDPVLIRHVPAATWRGGVVRTEGARVLVETLAGMEWRTEAELEPAEARDPVIPALRRGPVPQRKAPEDA